jgi:hypothetical protein
MSSSASFVRWEQEFKMNRAVNIVGNETWENAASGEGEKPTSFEPRNLREPASQGKGSYRFERDEEPRKAQWNSSLLLVQEACEAIKSSEERVQSLENEIEAMNAAHRDASLQMAARLSGAEEEIKAANMRARAFEARAIEAEAWLTRLNQAIVNGFGNNLSRDKSRSNGL